MLYSDQLAADGEVQILGAGGDVTGPGTIHELWVNGTAGDECILRETDASGAILQVVSCGTNQQNPMPWLPGRPTFKGAIYADVQAGMTIRVGYTLTPS